MSTSHTVECFCGAVEMKATGKPKGMGYCHCESCRMWSASPVNAFTLWEPDQVEVVKGEEFIRQYNKTENSDRKWCDLCGGHLMAGHPGLGLTDIYAALIPSLDFIPEIHVNYSETVLRIKDGLPKMKDFPSEFGGSGESVKE